jgi:hypothetical protein
MVTVLGGTDVHGLLSANLIASLGSVAVSVTIAVLVVRLIWKREAGDTVIAAFWGCCRMACWSGRQLPTWL